MPLFLSTLNPSTPWLASDGLCGSTLNFDSVALEMVL
jgi:hypothetical protein